MLKRMLSKAELEADRANDERVRRHQESRCQGIWYCYSLQTWIEDGVISDTGSQRDRQGEFHGKCEHCH